MFMVYGCFWCADGHLKKLVAILEFLMANNFSLIRDVESIFIPNFMLVSSNEQFWPKITLSCSTKSLEDMREVTHEKKRINII